MMKEWQEARDNVIKLKESNPKGADKLNKEIMQVMSNSLWNKMFFLASTQLSRRSSIQIFLLPLFLFH